MAMKNDKKEKAKALFLTGQYSQKEIAALVEVSEVTLSKWANNPDDNWEEFKTSLLTTKPNELKRLYRWLKMKNDEVEGKGKIDSKDTNAIIQLTSAINDLEIETSIAQIVDVGEALIELSRKESIEDAKVIAKWIDILINQR